MLNFVNHHSFVVFAFLLIFIWPRPRFFRRVWCRRGERRPLLDKCSRYHIEGKITRISKDKIVVRSIGISGDRELELPISNLSKMDRILLDRFQVEHLSPDKIDFSLFRFWTN